MTWVLSICFQTNKLELVFTFNFVFDVFNGCCSVQSCFTTLLKSHFDMGVLL